MSKKLKTFIIISATVLLFALLIVTAVTEAFAAEVILHSYFKILLFTLVAVFIYKRLNKPIPNLMKNALLWCGGIYLLDLVVLDAVRFVLSHGESTILFLPICLPLSFMILMHCSAKSAGGERSSDLKLTYIIGMPLLLLALYFEIASFIN